MNMSGQRGLRDVDLEPFQRMMVAGLLLGMQANFQVPEEALLPMAITNRDFQHGLHSIWRDLDIGLGEE
jgi:hypothetical protein